MQPAPSSLKRVIAITAASTFLYLLGIVLQCPLAVILVCYGATLLATVWMVLRILKDPYATDKTFADYFYLDRNDLRRGGGE